jgi:hypothetical protein
MRYVIEALSKELRNRREEIELQDLRDFDNTQGKRKSSVP